MDHPGLWIAVGAIVVLAGLVWASLGPLRRRWRRREEERAIQQFRLRREMLEARFFDLARTRGKPRGLRWADCEWRREVTFARQRGTGLLTAFVGVQIRFEAIEGGEMEGVAAVGNIRDAAAVFHYRRGRWGTGGRALFNMGPADALVRLEPEYEPVAEGATVSR